MKTEPIVRLRGNELKGTLGWLSESLATSIVDAIGLDYNVWDTKLAKILRSDLKLLSQVGDIILARENSDEED